MRNVIEQMVHAGGKEDSAERTEKSTVGFVACYVVWVYCRIVRSRLRYAEGSLIAEAFAVAWTFVVGTV